MTIRMDDVLASRRAGIAAADRRARKLPARPPAGHPRFFSRASFPDLAPGVGMSFGYA